MKRAGLSLAVLVPALLGATPLAAQTFPVVRGTLEVGAAMAAVALPEHTGGSISAQPELRVGYFIAEGMMVQVVGDTRVWPLGTQAPKWYGVAGQLLYFPNLGPRSRNLYLMAGAGGALVDPPNPAEDSSMDPLIRGGVGVKISLVEVGLRFLQGLHFTAEFREEYVRSDENDFLSGLSFGLSTFR